MAEAAGGKTQHQEGHGHAEAGGDPGQGHREHSWEENPYYSEQFPDDHESEEFSGEEKICQQASKESAHKGDTEQHG